MPRRRPVHVRTRGRSIYGIGSVPAIAQKRGNICKNRRVARQQFCGKNRLGARRKLARKRPARREHKNFFRRGQALRLRRRNFAKMRFGNAAAHAQNIARIQTRFRRNGKIALPRERPQNQRRRQTQTLKRQTAHRGNAGIRGNCGIGREARANRSRRNADSQNRARPFTKQKSGKRTAEPARVKLGKRRKNAFERRRFLLRKCRPGAPRSVKAPRNDAARRRSIEQQKIVRRDDGAHAANTEPRSRVPAIFYAPFPRRSRAVPAPAISRD